MTPDQLQLLALEALDDGKGQDILSLAQRVLDAARAGGVRPLGVEGMDQGDWILLDLGDVIVHVMQEDTRSFYDLERLWQDVPVPDGSQGYPGVGTGPSDKVVSLSEAAMR